MPERMRRAAGRTAGVIISACCLDDKNIKKASKLGFHSTPSVCLSDLSSVNEVSTATGVCVCVHCRCLRGAGRLKIVSSSFENREHALLPQFRPFQRYASSTTLRSSFRPTEADYTASRYFARSETLVSFCREYLSSQPTIDARAGGGGVLSSSCMS